MEFFSQDIIDITLEACRSIEKLKKHYLILEVIVLSTKQHFSFIAFFYCYLMISICEIKIDELFGLI